MNGSSFFHQVMIVEFSVLPKCQISWEMEGWAASWTSLRLLLGLKVAPLALKLNALQMDEVHGHLTFGVGPTWAWDGLPLAGLADAILSCS